MQFLRPEFQVPEYSHQNPEVQHLPFTNTLKCLLHCEGAKQGRNNFLKFFTQSSLVKS